MLILYSYVYLRTTRLLIYVDFDVSRSQTAAITMADVNNPLHVTVRGRFYCMMSMIPEETRNHICGYVGTKNVIMYNPLDGPIEPSSYTVTYLTPVIEVVSKFMWLAWENRRQGTSCLNFNVNHDYGWTDFENKLVMDLGPSTDPIDGEFGFGNIHVEIGETYVASKGSTIMSPWDQY